MYNPGPTGKKMNPSWVLNDFSSALYAHSYAIYNGDLMS